MVTDGFLVKDILLYTLTGPSQDLGFEGYLGGEVVGLLSDLDILKVRLIMFCVGRWVCELRLCGFVEDTSGGGL